ncbi:MAG: YdeI/OmpD-associated family protein [Polyangiales bacterium]
MPPVVPNPKKMRAFKDAVAFETWLATHHASEQELWLKIHKKGAGLPTVTYAEAVDVALCWGWIDGLRKAFDERSFLQRFTPRKPKSVWSQVNRRHVARLIEEGRITEHGQRHVDAAQADGRWDAAYAPSGQMTIPDDLAIAIRAVPEAQAMFERLSKQNLYALAYRTRQVKTAAVRAAKIARFVAMLARGETLYPQRTK